MFTLGFRFSLWKKMCSKPLPSPPAYPTSMLWSCSCLGFYSNFSCTDINVCMFVFLFCLLPLNCMFYVGPDTNVTWCYLIATEVRQSKAIIMLKLKLFMEAHRYFQNWFLSPTYMGTYSRNPEWAYCSDSTLPIHQSLFTSGMERGFFNKALYITPLPN